MTKTLNILWQMIKINLKQTIIYRVNFLITLWSMALWIAIYVIFFEVIFTHVDTVAGWNRSEMLLFLAFYYFMQSIGNIFYRESFEVFDQEIRRGRIDQALTKPASTQILLFFRILRFDHLVDFFLTFIIFAYIFMTTDLVIKAPMLIAGLLVAVFGNLLFYGLLLALASLLFYVEKMDGIGSFMWHLSQISRYPRQIYKGIGKILFEFIFPIALIASVPAEIALGKSSFALLTYFAFVSVIFFLLGNIIFRIGLKRYSSSN